MDKTEKYIKMCDCPEIQDGHKCDDGDYYYWESSHDTKSIWLPRQDQLQDMVFTKWYQKDIVSNIHSFLLWCNKNWIWGTSNNERFDSMEQLWLGFVMHKLYSKRWNGEKWRKSHEL